MRKIQSKWSVVSRLSQRHSNLYQLAPIHSRDSPIFCPGEKKKESSTSQKNALILEMLFYSNHRICFIFSQWFWANATIRAGRKKTPWGFQMSHEKKKTALLSMKYWLFNRDPYFMVYETIPTELGRISSPTNPPNNQGPSCSLLNYDG